MRERWAAVPDFQRTRGALRFLAACLRAAHREGKSRALLGPGDVPLHDAEVRLAFFKEMGQREDFQAVLEYDFLGAHARAKQIDDRRAREVPTEAMRRPATRLATAILMYSFGGLRREGAEARTGEKESELLPPGVSEEELLAACVGPDLDTVTALACLKELKERCLYLHFDGVRYCFKKDPNITLLLEQEADAVARDERQVRDQIKEMLEERLAGHREALVWPERSGDISDKDPAFLVAYLPLEFAAMPQAGQEAHAKELLEKHGDKPRSYRNGLGLAVPSGDQIEGLRRSVRYLLAAERVKAKARQHNLTDEQRGQLREREATHKAEAESAFLKLYMEVWFPKVEKGEVRIEPVAFGGRPPQTTLNEKKQAMIHQRVMELVTNTYKRVFTKQPPGKIAELFKLGEGTPPILGIRTTDVVDGFYSFLGFPRLMSSDVLRRGIAQGIKDRVFGYVSGAVPTLGPDGKYQVARAKVRFDAEVAEDEIDLDSGFLMLPAAVPVSAPSTGATPTPPGTADTPPGPAVGEPGASPPTGTAPRPPGPTPQTLVELSFSADPNKLYAAWQALVNLAEMAGKVSVTIRAESPQGFDRQKLNNGVIEPLREADLIE